MYKNWIDILKDSTDTFDRKNPGALKRIKENINVDNIQDDEYWDAAMAIVEPDIFLGLELEDALKEEIYLYYDRWDSDVNFVKGLSQYLNNKPEWEHIIDLILEYGY